MNIEACWGARKEPARVCAHRAYRFLSELAECSGAFAGGWLKCGTTFDGALSKPVDMSEEGLEALMLMGRNRRDSDGSIIEELGFRLGRLWNGLEDGSAHVTVYCGLYANELPRPNRLFVELPSSGSNAPRVLQTEKLHEIVALIVRNWDPDWARVSTFRMDEAIYGQGHYQGQKAGWLTYVSDGYGPLPVLPPDCKAERMGSYGSLIVITSVDLLTASKPEHVTAVGRLSQALGRAGLLAPTPPLR